VNGVHDMGGMHGFGPVVTERGEPVFHAAWEGRVLAMTRAMTYCGLWNIDVSRFSRESLPPALYLASSYYRKWHYALENLLVDSGLVARDELDAGRALRPGRTVAQVLTAERVPDTLERGSYDRAPVAPPRFAVGERVRARNLHPAGHTRLPRYVRGHAGVVDAVRGCHVFPDAVVAGRGEDPQWLYTVVFDAAELWGESADPAAEVTVDAWEPYLEVAAPR
jgi:nitrile hydratase